MLWYRLVVCSVAETATAAAPPTVFSDAVALVLRPACGSAPRSFRTCRHLRLDFTTLTALQWPVDGTMSCTVRAQLHSAVTPPCTSAHGCVAVPVELLVSHLCYLMVRQQPTILLYTARQKHNMLRCNHSTAAVTCSAAAATAAGLTSSSFKPHRTTATTVYPST